MSRRKEGVKAPAHILSIKLQVRDQADNGLRVRGRLACEEQRVLVEFQAYGLG